MNVWNYQFLTLILSATRKKNNYFIFCQFGSPPVRLVFGIAVCFSFPKLLVFLLFSQQLFFYSLNTVFDLRYIDIFSLDFDESALFCLTFVRKKKLFFLSNSYTDTIQTNRNEKKNKTKKENWHDSILCTLETIFYAKMGFFLEKRKVLLNHRGAQKNKFKLNKRNETENENTQHSANRKCWISFLFFLFLFEIGNKYSSVSEFFDIQVDLFILSDTYRNLKKNSQFFGNDFAHSFLAVFFLFFCYLISHFWIRQNVLHFHRIEIEKLLGGHFGN